MSIIKSIKQVLGLGPAAENHFWDGSVPNQLTLKRGTPDAPGAELIKALNGVLSFPNQGQSLTGNGYVKLPGGLIVQWGENSVTTDSDGGATISWPVPFPNALFQQFAINGDANGSSGTIFAVPIGLSTVSQGVFRAIASTTGSGIVSAPVRFKWIAIGY